jgi:hypothetical protein
MTGLQHEPWNRCDVCGKFISLDDFSKGAIRRLIFPDSEYTRETYETLCRCTTLPREQLSSSSQKKGHRARQCLLKVQRNRTSEQRKRGVGEGRALSIKHCP